MSHRHTLVGLSLIHLTVLLEHNDCIIHNYGSIARVFVCVCTTLSPSDVYIFKPTDHDVFTVTYNSNETDNNNILSACLLQV